MTANVAVFAKHDQQYGTLWPIAPRRLENGAVQAFERLDLYQSYAKSCPK